MPSGALSCPICYNDYDQSQHIPRVIQECGHTICTECILMIIQGKTSTKKCPLDNRKFSDFERTIESFPVNFTVHQLLDEKASRDLCLVHKDKLRLICLTDKTEICDECVFNGDHKGHDVRPLKKLSYDAEQKKAELESFLKDSHRCAQEIKEMVDEKKENLLKVVKEKFQELRWLITKKELELSFEVNALFDIEYNAVSKVIGPSQGTIKDIKRRIEDLDGISTPKEYFTAMDKNMFQEVSKVDVNQVHEQYQGLNHKLNKIACQLHERLLTQITCLTNIEFSLDSLLEEIPDETPGESDGRFANSKYDEKVNSRLNEMVQTEVKDDWLVVSTEKNTGRNYNGQILTSSSGWTKPEKIWLRLGECHNVNEHVQMLAKLWKNFNTTSVKIEVTSTKITDQDLLGLFSVIFGDNTKLQNIAVDLSDCKIGDESIIPFVVEILPKMSNLRSLSLNLNATRITSKSLENFIKSMKPTMRVLEALDIRLCGTNMTDRDVSQLFTKMERIKKFTLDLGYTLVTNECLHALATITLPSMRVLEELKLGLTKTNVTDEGINHVLSSIGTTKHLLLYLNKTNITDKSLESFSNATLPALRNLEALEMRLGNTKISDHSMIKLLDNKLKNVKKFILKLQSTKVSDKTAEKLMSAYPNMNKLEEFDIDISGTNISEEFAVQFLKMKERFRQ